MNYRVELFIDNIYKVWKYPDDAGYEEWEDVFQGTLADCEAFIRLDKEGLL